MSPLFQMFAYSLDESLIPTGFIQLLIPWISLLFQLVYSTAYSPDESLIPTVLFNCLFPGSVPYSNCFIQLLIPRMSPLFQLVLFNWMSPLFQLVYSTAYSPDESLIPTGFIQLLIPWMSPLFQLVYSTAYSLDESLIPTGFIQLFIPMAALIWSHFLFQLVLFNFLFRWPPLFGRTFYSTTGFIQQLFYSTAYSLSLIQTVLFNSCSPDGRPLILFNFLFRWPPLFGRTFYSTFYFYST